MNEPEGASHPLREPGVQRVVGGLLGLMGGLYGALQSVVLGFTTAVDAGTVLNRGLAGALFGILGVTGAAVTMRWRAQARTGGYIMLAAAAGGLVAVALKFLVAGALLLAGALVVLVGRRA